MSPISVPDFRSDVPQSGLRKVGVPDFLFPDFLYLDFIRKTMAAGCVGYFVQITGGRVIYFERHGELHVEHFPPAANSAIAT